MKILSRWISVVALCACLLSNLAPLAKERAEVAANHTWDLTQIYPDLAAWEAAKAEFVKRTPEVAAFQGRLGEGPEVLLRALETSTELDKLLSRVYSYASLSYDLDTRNAEAQQRIQSIQQAASAFSAKSSFVTPEILALGKEKVDGYLSAEPRLRPYAPYLDNILRMKSHTLSPSEERLMALAGGKMGGAAGAIYSIFTNADMPYPDVTLSTGDTVRMDASAYTKYRALDSRPDRDLVFEKFWDRYGEFKRTFGTALYHTVRARTFGKEARNYDSCLAAALDGDNIPTAVYRQLIQDVNQNLPTLHRYLKLRQRMMGVDQLRYEDLYANIVAGIDKEYTPEQGMELTLKACAPLGQAYTGALSKGFYQERWVDFFPSTGKRSGAYSSGAVYDLHPFQLLNFNGAYVDVSTLAHESGHSMHSYLSNKNQPYITADYSIFAAEVASTLNESLLLHYMLDHTADDSVRLSLLGSYLDDLRQTLFRQTLFAEFELRIHEMVESGKPLTGDSLSALYLELLRRYYGHDGGHCKVDGRYAVEWAYIPHFYRSFYVYQYATSKVASVSLSRAILEEAQKNANLKGKRAKQASYPARDAYLNLLSAGSSKYPVDLLKDAGVDMTTSAPFAAAMKEMNRVMDEMEALLAKNPRGLTPTAIAK